MTGPDAIMAGVGRVDRTSEEDGVALLVLRNPPVNALGAELLADLARRVEEIERDPEVRSVVLTGEGAYFSAGADLKELGRTGLDRAPEIVRAGQALFSRIAALRPPVVAAVNGLAVGGGLELALACDLRVVGDSAKLGAPEVGYGLMPAYGGTQRLARLIGPSKASELVLTGSLIVAAEAHRIGLANRVVPSGQELRAARDLAHTIARKAPKAVAAAKRAIAEGLDRPLSEGLALEASAFLDEVVPSQDLREGLEAFQAHRTPKFRGA
ncbi:MAG TPA: enoyl-CoA hydratase-related protein [Thermoplasmata archaeon]|nr:enoyl-CoA hydratase-related protein [Thermoplasmata archaeon]